MPEELDPTQGSVVTETAETPALETPAVETPAEETPEQFVEETAPKETAETALPKEEPEVEEFRTSVAARLRALAKEAPELAAVFKAHPQVQEKIAAAFRRDSAMREIFPTVAEARAIREHFPGGLQDVKQLLDDQAEVEELDAAFYTRDQEGNYPGHAGLIENWYQDDPQAMLSMFRQIPRLWARLDQQSYNEVMGKIVGASLNGAGIPRFLAKLAALAKQEGQSALEDGLNEVLEWAHGYVAERQATPEDKERERERSSWQREKQERDQRDAEQFKRTFFGQAQRLEEEIVKGHEAVKRVLGSNAISQEKKAAIVLEIRRAGLALLRNSASYMRKMNPLYDGRRLDDAMSLIRATWSQPWLLNKIVRSVLAKEVPHIVQTNREAVRRTGAPAARVPAKTTPGEKKVPYQEGGRWYRPNGVPFTTAEVLAGKHRSA